MSGGINALKVMKEGRKGDDADRRARAGAGEDEGGEEKSAQSSVVVIDVGSDQMGFLLRRDDAAFA